MQKSGFLFSDFRFLFSLLHWTFPCAPSSPARVPPAKAERGKRKAEIRISAFVSSFLFLFSFLHWTLEGPNAEIRISAFVSAFRFLFSLLHWTLEGPNAEIQISAFVSSCRFLFSLLHWTIGPYTAPTANHYWNGRTINMKYVMCHILYLPSIGTESIIENKTKNLNL